MNTYEELMEKSDCCVTVALHTEDVHLRAFWYNAGKGFKEKARNLPFEAQNEQD